MGWWYGKRNESQTISFLYKGIKYCIYCNIFLINLRDRVSTNFIRRNYFNIRTICHESHEKMGYQRFIWSEWTDLFHYDKSLVILLLFTFLFYDFIVLGIIFLVKRFLKSIIEGEIFTLTNSRRIEWIGCCIIFLSVTFKSVGAFFVYCINEIFNFTVIIQNSELVQSVSIQFFGIHWSMLLCGLIIWTIGYIFRYGSFLQQEFDATV